MQSEGREQAIELFAEELEIANASASGVRILLTTQKKEVIKRELWWVGDVELARAVGSMGAAAAQARENAVSTGLLRSMMEEHENAVKRIEELESIVDKLEGDRAYLKADSDLARRQYQAVSQVLEDLEAVYSCTQRDLASSERVVARLQEETYEFQARAVAAEDGQAAAADEAWRAAKATAAREEVLLAAVKVGESEVAAKAEELDACETALASKTVETRSKSEKIAALEVTLESLAGEAREKADMLAVSEAALARVTEQASKCQGR